MDSSQRRRRSTSENVITNIWKGSVIILRYTHRAAGVILVICILLAIWMGMRGARVCPYLAHAEVTQTESNDEVRSTVYDSLSRSGSHSTNQNKNDIEKLKKDQQEDKIKYTPELDDNKSKRSSKQLLNTDTSKSNTNENRRDRDTLKNVQQKEKIKNTQELENHKSKEHSKQSQKSDTYVPNINKNRNDKDKLKKDQQKDATKDKLNKNKTTNTVLSHRNIVVIVAYMRTGSTFTGSVFQEYPDTFYSFEPFRLLRKAFDELNTKSHLELEYMNGTKRKYLASERKAVTMNEINGWLSCKLESVSTLSLKSGLNRHFTKYEDIFNNCSKEYISNSCLKMAIRSCHKTPLVALKIIRIRMKEIAKLLPFYPNMKIVHLVRDPRGMFNSRMNSEAVAADNYRTTVQAHCSKLHKDLQYSKEIQEKYSDKVKILHYEDLAERPLDTARSLIEFVGLKFVKSVQNHMEQQTSASHDAGAFDTQRKNSTETANKWRSEIDPEIARYIYKTCKTSNSVLGYLPLDSVHTLRDQTIPSRMIKRK